MLIDAVTEIAILPQGRGGVHVIRVATGKDGGERREGVEDDDEQGIPIAVEGNNDLEEQCEQTEIFLWRSISYTTHPCLTYLYWGSAQPKKRKRRAMEPKKARPTNAKKEQK